MSLSRIDHDALTRAVAIQSKDPVQRRRIAEKLAAGEDWERVAGFCASACQHDALALMPWQSSPLWFGNHLDEVLREPFGDSSGRREAGEVLKKLLALGLSKFEPSPVLAIEHAEAEQRQAVR
jgi:hypothetical protein